MYKVVVMNFGNMKGQLALVQLFAVDLVGVIMLIMLQVFITASAPNFTAGSIARIIVDNIVPIGALILLLGNLAYLGMGKK
jgi:hypothetical protein